MQRPFRLSVFSPANTMITHFRYTLLSLAFPLLLALVLLSLVITGCGSSGGGDNTAPEPGNAKAALEADIRNDLNIIATSVDFTLYVKSGNGSTFLHSTGSSSESVAYQSASTSKLVSAVVILSLVSDGVLSLEDNPQKYIATWPSTGNLSLIKLKHLLNFTSGLTKEALCINLPGADFEDCANTIATKNNASPTPGSTFYYNSAHLQIAGLMAIKASGNTGWSDVFTQFQAKTGLLLNARYDLPSESNPRLAGGMHWNASDYLAFLDALYKRTILNDALIDQLFADQIAGASIGLSPAIDGLGEDWHYAYGNWLECRASTYNCSQVTRVSSPGSYGAYPFIDFENNYFGILARQGALGTFPEGIAIFRSVSDKLASWAALP